MRSCLWIPTARIGRYPADRANVRRGLQGGPQFRIAEDTFDSVERLIEVLNRLFSLLHDLFQLTLIAVDQRAHVAGQQADLVAGLLDSDNGGCKLLTHRHESRK